MNTRILTRAAAVTLALACTLPTVLPGQTGHRIVVTPYAGAFVPTGKLARFGHNAPSNAGLGLQQRNGLALGANASYWFTDRTGIEVGGMYAFSDAKSLAGPGGGMPGFPAAGTRTAYVLAGSARLMLNILPISERTAVRFGIGPAVIRHDGTAYKADETGVLSGLTDYGAALSLCTKLPLGNVVNVRLRAEDYIYRSEIRYFHGTGGGASDLVFDARTQHDLVFSAGLQMIIWR